MDDESYLLCDMVWMVPTLFIDLADYIFISSSISLSESADSKITPWLPLSLRASNVYVLKRLGE